MMDVQRNSIEILRKIAECLQKEVESWLANMTALIKARKDEEKALERAEEKARKADVKAEERQAKKERAEAAKAERKKQQEASAADKAVGDANPEAAEAKRKAKKRRHEGEQEIDEADFALVQDMSKIIQGAMPQATDVATFVKLVAEHPERACVAKLRRGQIKKVMAESRLFIFSVILFLVLDTWRVNLQQH